MKKTAATIESVNDRVEGLSKNVEGLNRKFDVLINKLDQSFEHIDQKFKKIDQQLEKIDQRFDGMDQRFDKMDQRFDKMDERFDKMDQRFDKMDQRFDGMDKRFNSLEHDVRDNTSSIQHLVAGAVTREDVRQIVKDEIEPVESRLLSAMDAIGKKHITFDEEVTIIRYNNEHLDRRVGIIEQTMGLPKAA